MLTGIRTRIISSAAAAVVAVMSVSSVCAYAAGGVAVNSKNFPDKAFREYVLEKIDTNGDKKLSDEEIGNAKRVYVNGKGISSLKGIEKLTALEYINCNENNLTSLDFSKNTGLVDIFCSSNKLTSLNVSKCKKLEKLICFDNELKALDVSKNTALVRIDCTRNKLRSLNFSKNPALTSIECSGNKLTYLNIKKNTALEYLDCRNNMLTSLVLPDSSKLSAYVDRQQRAIKLTDGKFDLSSLKGFDVKKASGWKGGKVSGTTLTVDSSAEEVTYAYDIGGGKTVEYKLIIKK